MELFLKIALAAVMVMMIVRLWPAAKEWMENGPRGSKSEWGNFIVILLVVVAFVALLIFLVRN